MRKSIKFNSNYAKRTAAATMACCLAASIMPAPSFAVADDEIAEDGTYTKTATVIHEYTEDEDWYGYTLDISVNVEDGKIASITYTTGNDYDSENNSYLKKALTNSKGIITLLTGKEASYNTVDAWDAVSGATYTSEAVKDAILNIMADAPKAEENVEEETGYVYGTLEIPYADFYQSEVGEASEKIDAVTSATTAKWKSIAGTYTEETETGGKILGVKFPVAMEKSVYETLEGSDVLSTFEAYTDGTVPAVYKEIDETGTLSELKGEVTALTGIDYTLNPNSVWGDIQLDADGLDLSGQEGVDSATIYGILLTTDDGTVYGLRHLENIWLQADEIAWSVGDKLTEAKGNTLSSEAYEDMQGKTITGVTYICANGIYTAELSQKVPYKVSADAAVEDGESGDGSVDFGFVENDGITKAELPEDFEASYQVTDASGALAENFTADAGKVTYTNALPGIYTLTVTDRNGKYVEETATFILTTDKTVAVPTVDGKTLVPAEGISAEEFANYIRNISKVTVKDASGTEQAYAASGHGALSVIKADGTVDLEASSRRGKVFPEDGTYTLRVSANGYMDIIFSLVIGENPSENPTEDPSENPSENPTEAPSENPSENPTEAPTENPTEDPSEQPSETTLNNPQEQPSSDPAQTETTGTNQTIKNGIATGDENTGWIFAFCIVLSVLMGSAALSIKRNKK